MPETFRDALLDLVIKEVLRAKKAKDDDRQAGAVSVLAEMLGKAIAMICDGDPVGIDRMLMGAEAVVCEIAADTARDVKAIQGLVQKARGL